ncbi:Target of EGR1, member 1 (Nuclear) [Mortierella alpina]|nr:Target of EGR1, member 1 (Nuclear) [Mortierella alpina]
MHVATLPLPTYNQVTKHNLAQFQPVIVQLLKQAAFIALDAEFTGLGSRSETTRAKDVQERYQHLCELAKSHALVAFGLAIFIRVEPVAEKHNDSDMDMEGRSPHTSENERAFKVHNFNFSMLVEKDYMVSPKSMLFLAENGLDLNQWIMEGIPYTGGDRLANEGGRGNSNGIMRSIFKRIMTRQVPVVVHNGFLDLIFLYQSFYADLPPKLATFSADLSDMFPGGLFDTKYISDYITRERSSFLAYLFRKYEREDLRLKAGNGNGNGNGNDTSAVQKSTALRIFSTFDIQPRIALPATTDQVAIKTNEMESIPGVQFCQDYAFHGVCKKNMRCGKSHNLDLILDAEEEQRDSKRRKRQKKSLAAEAVDENPDAGTTTANGGPDQDHSADAPPSSLVASSSSAALDDHANASLATEVPSQPSTTATRSTRAAENVVQPGEKFHSAYYDAFMTGTVFAHQLNEHKPDEIEAQAKNKIYLIGKSFPLMVEKSAFAKYSPGHERQRG